MKTWIFIFSFLCIFRLGYSQTQTMLFEKIWDEQYDNGLVYADQLENGDYFLIGWKRFYEFGPTQNYACRIDSIGTILWEKDWGNEFEMDEITKVIKLKDETYMACGWGYSGSGGYSDYTITNINAAGNILFHKYFDFYYSDYASDMVLTFDSCFVIWGGVSNMGDYFPAMLKVDRNGNEIWRRTQSSLMNYGQTHIVQMPDSSFIATGLEKTNWNSFYAKYSSNGTMIWIKYPFGLNDTTSNRASALRVNRNGTFDIYYRTYYSVGGWPQQTYYFGSLREYDNNGNQIVSREYQNNLISIYVNNLDSGFYGLSSNDNLFILDSQNVFLRTVGITGADTSGKWIKNYISTSDGGYLGFGQYTPDPVNIYGTFYVVKFSPDGRYQPEPFLETINVYPNPSQDGNITLSFDMLTDETVKIRVLASDGRLVYTDEIFCPANSHTELPVQLNLGTTSAGLYILETKTSGEYRRQKILITQGN